MTQHTPVLPTVTISWQHGNPYNQNFDDYYYSKDNAVEESSYVFIEGNCIPQRWQEFEAEKIKQFNIIETGFGGGLNFLNTANQWLNFQEKQHPEYLQKLTYTSIEGFPLTKQDFRSITDSWNFQFKLSDQLVSHYPPAIKGIYNLDFGNIDLKLILMSLDKALAQLEPKGKHYFDCVYLDGFAPSQNESMWDSSLLRRLSYFCKTGSTFSTYTAASRVRKSLINIGYNVNKAKGFGTKREMLTGIFQKTEPLKYKSKTPWFEYSGIDQRDTTTAIIGAGVAGCATAYALAKHGKVCTLIDSNSEPGGTIKDFITSSYSPYITADFNHISQFYWHAYYHLEQYLIQHKDIDYQQCGVFHVANNSKRTKTFRTAYQLLKSSGMRIQWLDAEKTQSVVGTMINHKGLLNCCGGKLNAKSLCQSLMNNPLIKTKYNTRVINIRKDEAKWNLETDRGRLEYDNVVFCGGSALDLIDDYELSRFDKIHGQVTSVSNTKELIKLKTIVNNGHYLIPSHSQDKLLIGSNYEQTDSENCAPTVEADIKNLRAMKGLSENLDDFVENKCHQISKLQHSESTSGIRLASRDHLPVIGPVPDMKFYTEKYPDYIASGRLKDCPDAKYINGLFVNSAHGSRGVTASLLSGEIISALLLGEQLPLSTDLYRTVHPARFFIRDQLALNL